MSGDGLLVVDKPSGWTSHDVVARGRRLMGTRRVGHAGTLDPMATGVLVLGVERATRLLGHLQGHDKSYDATLRLGAVTSTDDAEGEVVSTTDASGVGDEALDKAVAALRGPIEQLPPAYSAIQVGGVRSYAAARRGESIELTPRPVVVQQLEVLARRGDEVDVRVRCSAGTYIRALARDIGAALGVGAHLTALRRTASGPWTLADAHPLDDDLPAHLIPIADAAVRAFPRWDVDADVATVIGHGGKLDGPGLGPGPTAVFGPDGSLLSIAEEHQGQLRYLAVFPP